MPSNKKKKKPAANPARGFTTVSVPSKQKDTPSEEIDTPDDAPRDDSKGSETRPSQPHGESTPSSTQREVGELSSEELEKHLEESELHSIVDKYASKCKNDASRQATKLEKERRLLRPQAHPLTVMNWLPPELLNQILEKENKESKGPENYSSKDSGEDNSKFLSEEELCAKFWTLQQTLLELGISEHRTDEVLKSVPVPSSVDPLDPMLEWLAINCDESELPQYEERKPTAASFQIGEVDSATSGTATPQDDGPGTQKSRASWPTTPLDSSSEESDTPDDPQSLIQRYVSLNSRLYEIQPSIFNESKKKTGKSRDKMGMSPDPDPKVTKLKRKLNTIENDMLLDHDQAESVWKGKLEELRMGTAESSRRKLRAGTAGAKEEEPSAEKQVEAIPQGTVSADESESEHEDNLLGDMFLSELGGSAAETSILPSDIPMIKKHRDFGNHSGISPRRVLEDACRARDPGYRINYRDLSKSPHSHQKLVEIKWSKAQNLPPQVPLDDISCTADSRIVLVSMSSIATPTSQQAEFFISVVALFLIFSLSPKEKVFMKLSSPWRDLWDELVQTQQEHEEKTNMSALKNIRSLVQENRARFDEDVVLTHNFKRRNGTTTPKEPEPSQTRHKPEDENKLKQLWESRSSRGSFKEMLAGRQSLPIWQFKQQILDVLAENQALIICSETGSGKSTQIPSFILENELVSGRHCKIYVTEPRRISAMSLAKRVSEELGEGKNAIGTHNSLVGYAIRLESKTTPSSRLVFATTGVVIRMLERPQEFKDITHLVLDEVHERTIDSDFLLIILSRLLKERSDLKLVLMSATVNAQRFSDYLNGAPILDIPGRTYPVEVQYLEDAVALTGYGPGEPQQAADTDDSDEESPEETPQTEQGLPSTLTNYSKWTRDAVTNYNEYRMDYGLIVRLLSSIATNPKLEDYSKAVLVFMPGLAEIRRLHDDIMSESLFQKDWMVYSLHSSIATEDQEKAFQIPPKGVRKIVIATNIAETGITIPDVTAVIDTGKEKVMRFDERRQISRLGESFISRANAKQRRGRAGRVQNGICFHLFTKFRHDNIIPAEQTPEILRLSLQDLILRVKICKLGEIEATLAEALDPPSAKNIRRAIEALKEVGALTEGEALTSLGRQLARLPLDVFLGKLILYGTVFQCLDAAVSIAAILSCKSPFVAAVGSNSQKDLARKSFSRGDSDLLTLYNAYCAWKKNRSTPGMSEYAFCRKNSLSSQALINIEDVKTQLIVSIVDMGLLKLDDDELSTLRRARFTGRQRQFFTVPSHTDTYSSNDRIVNSVVAWSFYPRLLARQGKGWRSVANNRTVMLHPTSVNKTSDAPLKWLSYYHIMQTRGQNYNAHETSAVEGIAVALLCGDVAFKMYAGIISIDGSRIRFAVQNWKSLLALKVLSTRIREILGLTFRDPKKAVLSSRQAEWLQLWQQLFSVQGRQTERSQGASRIKMR